MSTALRGVPLALTRAQRFAPGTAPSRLKANSMRDVEVMHAVVQKTWPAMLMNTTTLNRPDPRALLRTARAVPAPYGLTEGSVEPGRVRAQSRAVHGDVGLVRRRSRRLQPAAAAGGLVAAGGDRGERAAPGTGPGGNGDPPGRQRARGVHARQRVLRGRDDRGRVLRGCGVLRARD